MSDNRDELLRQLRKEASETPLTGWTSKSGQPPPRFKSPPDDEYIDRLIVKGHPLDEMGDWIRRAAARRIAKRFGNRPAGAVDFRNTLIRRLVSRYVDAGLKRAEVIREVAKAAELEAATVRAILRGTR